MKNPLMTDTITVYNHYTYPAGAGLKNRYDRTVIQGVLWEQSANRNQDSGGKSVPDTTVSIIIPADAEVTDDRTYIDPEEYERLPEDDCSHWTLDYRGTSNPDIIVYGECLDEPTGLLTISAIKEKYKSCVIKAVEDYAGARHLPHWKVLGV